MRTALITTTIHVPRVLERYRQLDPDVAIFVAGDRQTPHAEARSFIEALGNAAYYSDADQEKLGYKCSETIGWNKNILSPPYSGVMASSDHGWINVGEFLFPRVYHRGFPYEFRNVDLKMSLRPVSGVRVGVAAGLWLGDPDIDAMERITVRPAVYQISKVLESGLVVDHACLSPFNSQNTAYI